MANNKGNTYVVLATMHKNGTTIKAANPFLANFYGSNCYTTHNKQHAKALVKALAKQHGHSFSYTVKQLEDVVKL